MNKRTYEWKSENYIPVGINDGGITKPFLRVPDQFKYEQGCTKKMFSCFLIEKVQGSGNKDTDKMSHNSDTLFCYEDDYIFMKSLSFC